MAFVAALALMATPGVAWGHGMHYIGTLNATGDGGGTVTATTGQGVIGTEKRPDGTIVSRNAGCPSASTFYGPYDKGYNAVGTPPTPEPIGCVDNHQTTGATFVNPGILNDPLTGPKVTISGSGFRPNTNFGVTYLFPNDPGDIDGDTEALPTDTNDPFCHRLYFQGLGIRDSFPTTSTGSFGPRTVQLAPYEIGGDPLGLKVLNGQLCISSERFLYKGPAPETGDYLNTSQGQSVPIRINVVGV